MKTKTTILACCVFAAGLASGADWVYDLSNNTISDGVWTFNGGIGGNKVNVATIQAGPSTLTPLDFSKPVTDSNDRELVINQF